MEYVELKLDNATITQYDRTKVMRDIIMWDLFTGAIEDIPQTAIVAIVIIEFDQISQVSILALFSSIFLILWKIVRLARNFVCLDRGINEEAMKQVIEYQNDRQSNDNASMLQMQRGIRSTT